MIFYPVPTELDTLIGLWALLLACCQSFKKIKMIKQNAKRSIARDVHNMQHIGLFYMLTHSLIDHLIHPTHSLTHSLIKEFFH